MDGITVGRTGALRKQCGNIHFYSYGVYTFNRYNHGYLPSSHDILPIVLSYMLFSIVFFSPSSLHPEVPVSSSKSKRPAFRCMYDVILLLPRVTGACPADATSDGISKDI